MRGFKQAHTIKRECSLLSGSHIVSSNEDITTVICARANKLLIFHLKPLTLSVCGLNRKRQKACSSWVLQASVSALREMKWYFWKCNQRLTRRAADCQVSALSATASGRCWHVESGGGGGGGKEGGFRGWLAAGCSAYLPLPLCSGKKIWDPVDARLAEGWKSIRETHVASQILLPTSYSCIPFALAVLTLWGVGVQPCPGGGWRVHAGCGSFWHLHSWAGRIASPDWNLSVDGIRWQLAKTKLWGAQACLCIQLCALCVCVCVYYQWYCAWPPEETSIHPLVKKGMVPLRRWKKKNKTLKIGVCI